MKFHRYKNMTQKALKQIVQRYNSVLVVAQTLRLKNEGTAVDWSIARKLRNKKQHSANGNMETLVLVSNAMRGYESTVGDHMPPREAAVMEPTAGPYPYYTTHLMRKVITRLTIKWEFYKLGYWIEVFYINNKFYFKIRKESLTYANLIRLSDNINECPNIEVFVDEPYRSIFAVEPGVLITIDIGVKADGDYHWHVSAKKKNKLQHATNGNQDRKKGFKKKLWFDIDDTIELYDCFAHNGDLNEKGLALLTDSLKYFKSDMSTKLQHLINNMKRMIDKDKTPLCKRSTTIVVKLWIQNKDYREGLNKVDNGELLSAFPAVPNKLYNINKETEKELTNKQLLDIGRPPKNDQDKPQLKIDIPPITESLSLVRYENQVSEVVDDDDQKEPLSQDEESDSESDDEEEEILPSPKSPTLNTQISTTTNDEKIITVPNNNNQLINGINDGAGLNNSIIIEEELKYPDLGEELNVPRVITSMLLPPAEVITSKITNNNIQILDKPRPVRTEDQDSQTVVVTKFFKMNKVLIKNENIWTIIRMKTPDFKSETSMGYFFSVVDEQVKLPQDYITKSKEFWAGKDISNENYIIWQLQTPTWAKSLSLDGKLYHDLITYGPLCTMYYNHLSLIQTNPMCRDTRRQMKNHGFWTRFEVLKKLLLVSLLTFYVLQLITMSTLKPKKYDLFEFRVPQLSQTEKLSYTLGTWRFTPTYCEKLFNHSTTDYCDKHTIYCWLTWKYSDDSLINVIINYCDQYVYNNDGMILTNWSIIHTMLHYIKALTSLYGVTTMWLLMLVTQHVFVIIVAPLIEETDRNLYYTLILIILERLHYGSFITLFFHLFMFGLAKLHTPYHIRVIIHVFHNMCCVTYMDYTASSVSFAFLNISSRLLRKFYVSQWNKYKTCPLTTYNRDNGFKVTRINVRSDGYVKEMFNKTKKLRNQVFVGICDKDYAPIAFASNHENEKEALDARVLKETPEPDIIELQLFFVWLKRNIKKILPKTLFSKISSCSFDEYIENSNASSSVKQILKKTNKQLIEEGINEHSRLSDKQVRKWCKRKSFVKVENLLYKSPLGKKSKAPRLIQGAQPQFICLVGPWIAAVQKVVKQDWNYNNFIVFTSGVPADRCARNVTKFDKWLEDDVSAWDSSCSQELLRIEAWLFEKIGAPLAVRQLIIKNINTYGVTGNGWSYARMGCRKSGDPYTSLGNSLLNGLIHLYIFCKFYGCTVKQSKQMLRMLVQGDDNLLNYSSRLPSQDWKKQMLRFGFSSIAIHRTKRDFVEFCSMRIYDVVDGVTFGPKPGKVLAKFGVFCDPPTHINPLSMLKGTAIGLVPSCNHIPPIMVAINRILELTKHVEPCFQSTNEDWKMMFKCKQTCIATWSNLHSIYKWDHSLNEILKKEYSQSQLGDDWLGPISRYIMDRDTSGQQVYLW